MKSRYLKKNGVKPYLHKSSWKDDDDGRYARYAKEAKKVGVDERETWCLFIPFAEWLYTRVCLYEKAPRNIIDISYYI